MQVKSFHKLRKTYASMCNANGVPIDFIREQLGHASLSTTYGYIYNPLTEAESYKMLTDALSRQKPMSKEQEPDNTEPIAENVVSIEAFQSKKQLSPKCPQMSPIFQMHKNNGNTLT